MTDSYLYDAFGVLLLSTGSTQNPFRFVGHFGYYSDGDTLLYYVRSRFYAAGVGSFLSRDVLDPWPVSSDLYRYTENNPTNLTDPSGRAPQGPPIDFAKDACREAITQGLAVGLIGGVVCCRCKPYACVFDQTVDKWPNLYACYLKHERRHLPYSIKDCSNRMWELAGGDRGTKRHSECVATRSEMNCLVNARGACASLPDPAGCEERWKKATRSALVDLCRYCSDPTREPKEGWLVYCVAKYKNWPPLDDPSFRQ